MRVRRTYIKKSNVSFQAAYDLSSGTRALRNTACFYQRNLMTGLKKAEADRTENEKKVISDVMLNLQKANDEKIDRFFKTVQKCASSDECTMAKHAKIHDRLIKALHPFPMPTEDKWLLTYEMLDAIFKLGKNECYYALPAQVNQQALRKSSSAWTAYIRSLKK